MIKRNKSTILDEKSMIESALYIKERELEEGMKETRRTKSDYEKVVVYYTSNLIDVQQSDEESFGSSFLTFVENVKINPNLCDINSTYFFGDSSEKSSSEGWIITPLASFMKKRIQYQIVSLRLSAEDIIDNWISLAKKVESDYSKFDGFVVLHSLESLEYTSAGLSYIFNNLGKSVILTTGFIPITNVNNDIDSNLLGALTLAGNYTIPEVAVYANDTLYRGNRIKRDTCDTSSIFVSPNYPCLAKIHHTIEIDWDSITNPPVHSEGFSIDPRFSRKVGRVTIVPEMNEEFLELAFGEENGLEGILLLTNGNGRCN